MLVRLSVYPQCYCDGGNNKEQYRQLLHLRQSKRQQKRLKDCIISLARLLWCRAFRVAADPPHVETLPASTQIFTSFTQTVSPYSALCTSRPIMSIPLLRLRIRNGREYCPAAGECDIMLHLLTSDKSQCLGECR